VCAKDFKEGKVVRATGEELEKIKEESKKEFEEFGPKQLHVFGSRQPAAWAGRGRERGTGINVSNSGAR
jgi:hypothetical protein